MRLGRTVIGTWVICVMGLVGLLICANIPSEKLSEGLFTSYVFLLGTSVLALAGKSLGQHTVEGGGIRGAMRTLMGSADPQEPPKPSG